MKLLPTAGELKAQSALFSCFLSFPFFHDEICAARAMPRDGGRWCVCSQTHEMLPKHPQVEMGAGPLASLGSQESWSLEMPNNSPIPRVPDAAAVSGASFQHRCPSGAKPWKPVPPLQNYESAPTQKTCLLAWRQSFVVFIRAVLSLFMCKLQDSFTWDNITRIGPGVRKTVDNNTGPFILCGIIKVKTAARQQRPITVSSYLQIGKNSPS